MIRRADETTEAYHERLAAGGATVTHDQPQAVPDMVLVPREPTPDMVRAGWKASERTSVLPIYGAMLAARPVLPVETLAAGRIVADAGNGLHRAIAFVSRRRDDYVFECGTYDHTTGATEFPGNGEEYVYELDQIIEGLETMAAGNGEPVPDTTACGIYRRALLDVRDERDRQMKVEGWSVNHDDRHVGGEIAAAAACYAEHASMSESGRAYWQGIPLNWPWDWSWWKPKDRRRDLVRAAALIVAEIERLDRAAAKGAAE